MQLKLIRHPVFLGVAALIVGIGIFGSISQILDTARVHANLPCCCQTLTVNKDGSSTGTVRSTSPTGIHCGTGCDSASVVFNYNTDVTLEAISDGVGRFTGWSGDGCAGSAPTCTVTMDRARTITARFEALRITDVSVPAAASGFGWVRQYSPFTISVTTSYPAECNLIPTQGNPVDRGTRRVDGNTTHFEGIQQNTPVVYTTSCTDGQATVTRPTRINVLPKFRVF
jgi:hypothetical protein